MEGEAAPNGATVKHVERVGIRELRQNASVYVEKVKAGESVEITQRGELVALMVPPPLSPIERLRAEGNVIEATSDSGWADVKPGPPITDGPSLSEILRQMRDEERW